MFKIYVQLLYSFFFVKVKQIFIIFICNNTNVYWMVRSSAPFKHLR